jgi:hypothetical protein
VVARHRVDVAAVAPALARVIDNVVQFEIVGIARVADFLGPGPGGSEHHAPLVAALKRLGDYTKE